MLNYIKSRFTESFPHPQRKTGPQINESGMALVLVDNGGGEGVVAPSSGIADETFHGISIIDMSQPRTLAAVFSFIATGDVQNFPAGTLAGYIDGSEGIAIKTSGTAGEAATQVSATDVDVQPNGAITTTADFNAGDKVTIFYSYAPTPAQVIALAGHAFNSAAGLADPGVARRGLFYTSCFQTTQLWAVQDVPKLGANGTFTKTGSGKSATGAIVVDTPTADYPYLGLEVAL